MQFDIDWLIIERVPTERCDDEKCHSSTIAEFETNSSLVGDNELFP
jgi:hypothetical protein